MGLFAERLQAGGVRATLMRVASALIVAGWKISPGEMEKLTQRVAELGRGGNTNSNIAHVSCLAKLPTLSLKDLGKCGLNLVPRAWLKALHAISTLTPPFSSRFFWVTSGGTLGFLLFPKKLDHTSFCAPPVFAPASSSPGSVLGAETMSLNQHGLTPWSLCLMWR